MLSVCWRGEPGEMWLPQQLFSSVLLCPAGVQAHPEKPSEHLLTVGQIFSSTGSGSALFLPAFWAMR